MLKKLFFLLSSVIFWSCNSNTYNQDFNLKKDNNFPQWLSVTDHSSNQTSGITFIGTDSSGNKNFLIADDIGAIHHLSIKNDSVVNINPVYFSENAKKKLSRFSKPDFEEILYDKYTRQVYVSIEGNLPSPVKNSGIFKIRFAGNNLYSDTISSVEEINIVPDPEFRKYLGDNIGYRIVLSAKRFFSANPSSPR